MSFIEVGPTRSFRACRNIVTSEVRKLGPVKACEIKIQGANDIY